MQTILGAGGAIGTPLAKALIQYTSNIRLVSRNPVKVNETDQLFPANLLNPEDVMRAIKGSEIVYITIGFPYSYSIWKTAWPTFMNAVINACKKEACKLVFFDNIYMYDPLHLDGMTEETPINPGSKKGKVRALIAQRIMDEINNGTLTALIARSADFYGPSIKGASLLTETVFKNLSQNKKANWLVSEKYKHSFTYTPDAAKATALLGNTEDAYNQVWHLPTAPNPLTGQEWINAIANEMNVPAKYRIAPKWMIRLMGVFLPIMKETVEMLYQYDRDYVFDSNKFEKRFGIAATPYLDGIQEIVESDYS